MKKQLLPILMLVLAAMLTNFFAQRVWAQSAPGVLTAEQATAIKAIKIGNLEKDTYFKTGGFILDRYEERPAYVFTYSDGITRKIYLYRVFAATDTKELGLLAVYQNGKTGEVKPFVLPGANADRTAWDAYLDDLKYVGEKEPGLLPALTFVLSREMSLLQGGPAKPDEGGTKKKEDYNFCFARDALVTLADGSVREIATIKPGDAVRSYDAATKSFTDTRVTRVDSHTAAEIALAGVWLVPTDEQTAWRSSSLTPPVLLEATANHPVLTEAGRKPLGAVQVGETLYHLENAHAIPYRVVRLETQTRRVPVVYNLQTERGTYLVGDVVVLDK